MDYSPLLISLKTAFFATLITFVTGIAAARMTVSMKRGRAAADALFSLPMVLPPTVVGFFLLIIFGRNGYIGAFLAKAGISVIFTVKGAVAAAAAVSFPLMYRTARGAFEQIDTSYISAARTLGMNEFEIFTRLMLPMASPGIAAGAVLSFTRAIGEFGATVMLAGNIPGKTRTMSIAVYTAMQSGDRALAYRWVLIILVISFASVILINAWDMLQKTIFKRKYGK